MFPLTLNKVSTPTTYHGYHPRPSWRGERALESGIQEDKPRRHVVSVEASPLTEWRGVPFVLSFSSSPTEPNDDAQGSSHGWLPAGERVRTVRVGRALDAAAIDDDPQRHDPPGSVCLAGTRRREA